MEHTYTVGMGRKYFHCYGYGRKTPILSSPIECLFDDTAVQRWARKAYVKWVAKTKVPKARCREDILEWLTYDDIWWASEEGIAKIKIK